MTEPSETQVLDYVRRVGLSNERLGDLVHDAASRNASDINNGGIESQIAYLLEQHGSAGVLALLRDQ
ncbi:hypothetical protein ACFVYP_39880 [Kitasatospora sp. NPDC058201]|uniref:hypothetical protein n=1 Tax=unclassified Kitasatospora TaxID=2633591 RepID=UPI00364CBD60